MTCRSTVSHHRNSLLINPSNQKTSTKTSRYADADLENKQLTPIYGYWSHPLVPFEQALQPILPLINRLDRYIKVAKENCTYPSDHLLTIDESAALYIYTMESGKSSFYRVLNRALRSDDRTVLKPWFAFLKLFNTALAKLPSLKKVVWRGVRHDVSKELKDNQTFTWWSINSCSTSIDVIKDFLDQHSTLLLIEAINAKDISGYTGCPTEDEVILGPGTRLRVVNSTLDRIGGFHVVHLKEISDKNDKESMTTKTIAADKLRTRSVIELAYTKLPPAIGSKAPKIVKNSVFGREDSAKSEPKLCISYPNGDRYEGSMKDGKKQGQGTYHFLNGDIYTGEWIGDKMDGQGTFVWSNGNRYEGNYKDGKMHGQGIFSFVNGEKYIGSWADNMRNGVGIYSWPNGDHYEGEHKDNTFHGQGRHVLADGQSQVGDWKNNRLID